MKKILFTNASKLMMSTLLLILILTSCKKQSAEVVQSVSSDEIASAKLEKPGSIVAVSLKMTINDAAGYNITSDAGGDYVNGSQNLKVVFDQYGNFMFSRASNNPNVPMTRYLNYNFSDPLTPNPPVTGIHQGIFISTGPTSTSPAFTPLQNLGIGATQCIGFSGGLTNIEGSVVNFHRNTSTEDTPNTPTAYVYVTRISSTQWIMTPIPPSTGGCSAISNVAALRVSGVLYGYYNMPFSFTLTKQP